MKSKNLNNFKQLYWKTNKEQIMQIMHHLNIKYLLSLYKNAIHKECVGVAWTFTYPSEDDWKTAYVSVYQIVNYDGCRFRASVKTLKDELKRREANGEIIAIKHTTPSGLSFKTKWEIYK